jgi:NADH-quinone oxidoreductase subunit L
MFAACGAGVFAAGMYHVMTHAFFKACLFLGSGSVIHAVEHGMHAHDAHATNDQGHADAPAAEHGDSADESTGGIAGPDPHDPQDMRNMGGLFGRIPITAWTMLAATCAISGVFPFAGFWSKDQILASTWHTMMGGNWLFWAVGAFTALLTAFYMFRLMMKTFGGQPRTEAAKDAHESPISMWLPLVILAALATISGWAILQYDRFADFLAPAVGTGQAPAPADVSEWLGIGVLIAVVLVIIYCFVRYRNAANGQLLTKEQRAGFLPTTVLNKYYVDEAYNFWFVKLGKFVADWLWLTFDIGIVDGIVNGIGWLTNGSGQIVRRFQNGYVRSYAFSMVVGILLVLVGCLAGLGYMR